jgi:uncharacterized membrane protein
MDSASPDYLMLAYLHLATIAPAFLIGTFLLLNPKGTPWHRMLGKVYMVLMLLTAVITLSMPARVGPQFLHHFGFIHLFSVMVIWTVPVAYLAARRGDIKTHRSNMLGMYIGGLLIAGSFAFMPGRLLHHWLFNT